MAKDSYLYPAIFKYGKDGITITFPDLPGCISCGKNDEEALYMARDVLGGWMYQIERTKEKIPKPSSLNMMNLNFDEKVLLIDVWMPSVRKSIRNKAVKKTLTIPQWLNERATEKNLNFSHVLQEALKEELGIK